MRLNFAGEGRRLSFGARENQNRMSVFHNERTRRLRLASKNNDFGALSLCRNFELTLGCATIAYQEHKQLEGD